MSVQETKLTDVEHRLSKKMDDGFSQILSQRQFEFARA